MHLPTDIPDLAIVRALSSGGPYAEGDAISIAFATPKIGRLVSNSATLPAAPLAATSGPLLPETISVIVTTAAGPYRLDDILTLSFVDPAIARIHVACRAPDEPPAKRRTTAIPAQVAAESADEHEPVGERRDTSVLDIYDILDQRERNVGQLTPVASALLQKSGTSPTSGVRLFLSWSDERARRFVQVTDKLFTVDRLGWYRHAFAMRLLIPDEITTGDPQADVQIAQQLRALRSATLETLGRPLLAAFMPAFSVTSEWLDTIDSVEAVRALSGLRSALLPHTGCDTRIAHLGDEEKTVGVLLERDLIDAPAAVEAALPLFIANVSFYDDVTVRLTSYRQALLEHFGGAAQCADVVRLGQMTQPNHGLDDRLWQLVGVVSERFGGLAVA